MDFYSIFFETTARSFIIHPFFLLKNKDDKGSGVGCLYSRSHFWRMMFLLFFFCRAVANFTSSRGIVCLRDLRDHIISRSRPRPLWIGDAYAGFFSVRMLYLSRCEISVILHQEAYRHKGEIYVCMGWVGKGGKYMPFNFTNGEATTKECSIKTKSI